MSFGCVENCGGAGGRWLATAFGSTPEQSVTIQDNGSIATYEDGRHYACYGGGFDSGVKDAVQSCLNDGGYACVAGAVPGGVLGIAVSGPSPKLLLTLPAGTLGGCAVGYEINAFLQQCIPRIMGRVSAGAQGACTSTITVELVDGELVSDVQSQNTSPFQLCKQIPTISDTVIDRQVSMAPLNVNRGVLRRELKARQERLEREKQSCCECYGGEWNDQIKNCQEKQAEEGYSLPCAAGLCPLPSVQPSPKPAPGLYTAVGCIPTDRNDIIASLLQIALGFAGGLAFLRIIYGAFLYTISSGEPKRYEMAKDTITSSVIGLLFIIFSISILRFLAITVLRIPGF